MHNRIEKKFKELKDNNQKALITFLTAGDPDIDTSYDVVEQMINNGIDILEIGIPFSDPLAEGPTIEKASYRALASHTTTDDVFSLVKRIRENYDLPIILMLYVNLIYKYGIENFMKKCSEVGVDGLIVPDLPFEEVEEVKELAHDVNLLIINLVAPTTKSVRLKKIINKSEGFIYCVSSLGVTGERKNITTNLSDFYDRLRTETDLPLALGFGLSNKEQIDRLKGNWDGYIVGSAIVNIIALYGKEAPTHVGNFIKSLKD
ncbi:MAG: tryptophan synthase alpha chain [Fusobacteria bacterium]|nr:MAG: tryptophan synthase alpha chain [Fusobacteriota bacterium]KAF0230146.1 MAG: tryptophan synthase alpha [Fusobacteriota bacterium]